MRALPHEAVPGAAVRRARIAYLALAVGTMAVGLFVHLHGRDLGLDPDARDVAGDALWSAMMLWWVSAALPVASWRTRAGIALTVCFAVEASQGLDVAWLESLRHTTVGHLVLGTDLDVRDFGAYALGIASGVLLDRRIARPRVLPDPQTRAEQ